MKYSIYAQAVLSCDEGEDLNTFLVAPIGMHRSNKQQLSLGVADEKRLKEVQDAIEASADRYNDFQAALKTIAESPLTPQQKSEARTSMLVTPGFLKAFDRTFLLNYVSSGITQCSFPFN